MKENVAEFLEFRYEKLKRLKFSERGEVWLASARHSGELVIIKRVAATGLPYDVLKNFSFALPAKVLYCAEDAAETVIVEEFIQGDNLFERLARKNFLNESEARAILLQMCDGLAELHAQKIIHRDIKPSNMILQGDKIRLIDFDAARIFKEGQYTDTRLLGTKGYAPPEQFGSGQTDPRSDIYALGVTFKELLGTNGGGRLKKILDKCTAFDPAERFQSVDELKSALTAREPRSHKKFRAALIFLTTAGILFATSPTLNRAENPAKEITPQVAASSEEKISVPAPVVAVKFPEIIAPPIEPTPVALPQTSASLNLPPVEKFSLTADNLPAPVAPPQNYSGLLKTKFYLNGAPYNQDEHKDDREQISRKTWSKCRARLHIINDTGDVWRKPAIKFVFRPNWGGDAVEATNTLPALNVGASADFDIPFDSFDLPNKKPLAVCLQIYLEGDETKSDEHYWCVWFDIVD